MPLRIVFVVTTIFTGGLAALIYLLLWMVLPGPTSDNVSTNERRPGSKFIDLVTVTFLVILSTSAVVVLVGAVPEGILGVTIGGLGSLVTALGKLVFRSQ